jgi:hypothetical protein
MNSFKKLKNDAILCKPPLDCLVHRRYYSAMTENYIRIPILASSLRARLRRR